MSESKLYVNASAAIGAPGVREAERLATALAAEMTEDIPQVGDLLLYIDTASRPASEHMKALMERRYNRGLHNYVVLNSSGGFDSTERWRPYFDVLKKLLNHVFVRHPFHIPFLRQFGIESSLLPLCEVAPEEPMVPTPNTLFCAGEPLDFALLASVARLLPNWLITVSVTPDTQVPADLPTNCKIDTSPKGHEMPVTLSNYETIWLPQCVDERIHSHMTGLSAICSGRRVIVPDVPGNKMLQQGAALRHAYDASAEEIADLIEKRTQPDARALASFVEASSPSRVADLVRERIGPSLAKLERTYVLPAAVPATAPVTDGLYVHLDATDPRSYPGKGLLWHDMMGNHDAELPGECSNTRADPHWTGRSFLFKGQNFMRLLGSQGGFFKTMANRGAQYSIDCYFRTGSAIRNPHFLLADCAHGNPVEGSGFGLYFYFFERQQVDERACLRYSVQNNAKTELCRSAHCSHPKLMEPWHYYRAAVSVDANTGRGVAVLNDVVHEFDGAYIEATDDQSPYYVNIGAPGNIEYNVEQQLEQHVSQIDFSTADYDARMQTPYGRMRFNPGFELYSMMVYNRALEQEELDHNGAYQHFKFDGLSGVAQS